MNQKLAPVSALFLASSCLICASQHISLRFPWAEAYVQASCDCNYTIYNPSISVIQWSVPSSFAFLALSTAPYEPQFDRTGLVPASTASRLQDLFRTQAGRIRKPELTKSICLHTWHSNSSRSCKCSSLGRGANGTGRAAQPSALSHRQGRPEHSREVLCWCCAVHVLRISVDCGNGFPKKSSQRQSAGRARRWQRSCRHAWMPSCKRNAELARET